MSTGLWEGVVVRRRLGGHDGMGSGVKVRAKLDRVSGLTLRPEPIRSTMSAALPAVLERWAVSVWFVGRGGYVSSESGA